MDATNGLCKSDGAIDNTKLGATGLMLSLRNGVRHNNLLDDGPLKVFGGRAGQNPMRCNDVNCGCPVSLQQLGSSHCASGPRTTVTLITPTDKAGRREKEKATETETVCLRETDGDTHTEK